MKPGDGEEATIGPGIWVGLGAGLVSAMVAAYLAMSLLGVEPLSDALIPVYVSLTRWQPYCVGMARFGMLVPLLALPVADPALNYLLQNFLNAWCGVAVFFLVGNCLAPGIEGFAIGAIGLALYIGLETDLYQYLYLSSASHWGVGLALALLAFLAWRTWRNWARPVGTTLLLLALWVDVTAPLFVVPFIFAVWISRTGTTARFQSIWRRRAWESLVLDRELEFLLLMTTLFCVNVLLAPLVGTEDAQKFASVVPVPDWPRAWSTLLHKFVTSLPIALGAPLSCSAMSAALAVYRKGPIAARYLPRGLSVTALIAVQIFGLGISSWVQRNAFSVTYLFPARIALFTLPALVAVAVASSRGGKTLGMSAAAAAVAVASALAIRHVPHQIQQLRTSYEFHAHNNAYADTLIKESCTHFVARDEPAWPAGFFAAVLRHRAGQAPLTVLTGRLGAGELSWRKLELSTAAICAPTDDTRFLEYIAGIAHWPALEAVRRTKSITIWRARRHPDW